MPYRYAVERQNATHLASGRVIHALPGAPALPVRLADEVFQRCLAAHPHPHPAQGITLLDPCCGAGYHLTVLGLLHTPRLQRLWGVDIDPRAVDVARRNLRLLSVAGLEARAQELTQHAVAFGKESHRDALASAHLLRDSLTTGLQGRTIATAAHVADALIPALLMGVVGPAQVDMVIADVPYGLRSQWQGAASAEEPLTLLLTALHPLLAPHAVVALIADKAQKAHHSLYRRIEQFQVGTRRITLLTSAAP
ncbi:MAG: rRNA methyltransferase [Caldilineaceae bacterium]